MKRIGLRIGVRWIGVRIGLRRISVRWIGVRKIDVM